MMEATRPAAPAVDPPPPPAPQKLRLMCSYGGHIIPRPHDKTLSYIGGDTRIVLVDRSASFGDLYARLSKTLNHNHPFTLKYQIPNEDLDTLISVTTDEDFQNMVEEYDRLANKHGRLRLFLFAQAVQSVDLGQVCGNKGSSEEWFLGILNGKVQSLPTGFSDSVNCLLGLELNEADKAGNFANNGIFLERNLAENERKLANSGAIPNQDVNSVPDSPIIPANSSSLGSNSSSKSVKMVGAVGVVEEQFHQTGGVHNTIDNANVSADHKQQNSRGVSDDERSDDGRKAQEIAQQIPQIQHNAIAQQVHQWQGGAGAFELPSPDSVSSEGSFTNPLQRQRPTIYQEPSIAQTHPKNQPDLKILEPNTTKTEAQTRNQESSYLLSGQYNPHYHHPQNPQLHHQQHFVQYIPSGSAPITSYYPVYPPQQHQNHPNQPVFEQSYPVYFIQARPSQAYNLPMQQQNYGDFASNVLSTQPQKPPAPKPVAYDHHQMLNVPSSTAPQQLVQVPSTQHQTQYLGYAQVYGYDISDQGRAQMHYASSSAMADSSLQINAAAADIIKKP